VKKSATRLICAGREVGQSERGAFERPRINPCAKTSAS